MQKILMAMAVPLLVAGLTARASAALVVVEDLYDPGNDVFLDAAGNKSHSWTHDIRDNGFNPTTDTIVAAGLILGLRDDQRADVGERVDIKLDGDVLGLHRLNLTTAYSTTAVWVDVSYLQNDGKLSVKLTATTGDFYLVDSTLAVAWNHPTGVGAALPVSTVPEPGSALLLGLGIVAAGFGWFRRKAA